MGDTAAELLARHPLAVAAVIGALGAWFGLSAYRTGLAYAGLRAAVADRQLATSEALGG